MWGDVGNEGLLGEPISDGTYSGKEENFSSKFTVSKTLSIPSSLIAFLKKLFLEGVAGVNEESFNRISKSSFDSLLCTGEDTFALIWAGVGARTNFVCFWRSSFDKGKGSVGRDTCGEFGNMFSGPLQDLELGHGGKGCFISVMETGIL